MTNQLPSDLTITTLPKIGGHGDVVRKLYEARLALPDIGNASHNDAAGIHYSHGAIVARIASDIVGVISFDIQDHSQSMFIVTGWVDENYRGEGVYRAMFAQATEFAKEKSLLRISGATTYNNRVMQQVMLKLGRTPVAIIYEMDISK